MRMSAIITNNKAINIPISQPTFHRLTFLKTTFSHFNLQVSKVKFTLFSYDLDASVRSKVSEHLAAELNSF